MKIVVVTQGGLVCEVYCDQNADVEIIDLDEPSFATEDELAEHEVTLDRYDEIVNDASLVVVS